MKREIKRKGRMDLVIIEINSKRADEERRLRRIARRANTPRLLTDGKTLLVKKKD